MRNRIVGAVLSAHFASSAAASVDCNQVVALSRLTGIIDTHSTWSNGGIPPESVQSDMRRFDADSIQGELGPEIAPFQTEILSRFAALTDAVSQAAKRGDAATVQRLLGAPDAKSIFSRATVVLAQLGCDGPRIATRSTIGNGENHTSPPVLPTTTTTSARQLDFTVPLVLIVTLIAAAATFASLAFFFYFKPRKEEQRRRARRHLTRLDTHFREGSAELPGRVVDISCAGLKLRHFGNYCAEGGCQVQVLIGDVWYSGSVSWSNDHYLGLAFTAPLQHTTLLGVLVAARNPLRRPKNAQTAPDRAPLKQVSAAVTGLQK
jgi:hypothetical protein